MNKTIIFDTDIVSTFAKVEKIKILKQLFCKYNVSITPKIHEELIIPLNFGYNFPLNVFRNFGLVYPSQKEEQDYLKLSLNEFKLGKGELEAIIICKRRGYIFSSLDKVALSYASREGIDTIQMHSILRAMWKSGLQSRDDVKKIIKNIEEMDKTQIKNIEKIFQKK